MLNNFPDYKITTALYLKVTKLIVQILMVYSRLNLIIFQCSTQCAVGTKRRQVLCSRIDEFGNFSVIDYEFCRYLDNPPPTEAPCNEDSPCGGKPLHLFR